MPARPPRWFRDETGIEAKVKRNFLLCGGLYLLLRRWDRTRKASVERPKQC